MAKASASDGRSSADNGDAQVAISKSSFRILRVLSHFVERGSPAGVTELGHELGMTKNMVHRALMTLLDHDLVARTEGQRYDLGYGVLNFGGNDNDSDIRALCQPYLRKLYELTGESLFLSVIFGKTRVNIDGIEARGPRISHVQRGRARPLHITGNARVLLAFLTDAEIRQYIAAMGPFETYEEGKVRSEEQLWSEIRSIRQRGYTIEQGEVVGSLPIATYVSFPVLDATRRPHAAITVGGPAERFTLGRVDGYLPTMLEIIAELNRQTRLIPASPAFYIDA